MSGGAERWAAWRRVVRYECVMVWRDPAIWVAAILLVLLTAAGWSTARHWIASQDGLTRTLLDEQTIRLRDLQQRMDREREKRSAEGQPLSPVMFGSRHATTIGHYMGQRWLVQPMLPTGPLAIGEADLQPLGYMASVDRWQGQQQQQFSSPLWQRFVRFDVFFVVGYLFPLALIVVCAGTLSAEREDRTLSLRLTQGSRPWTIACGRVALRGGLLTLIVGITVAAIVWGSVGLGADVVTRVLLWEAGLIAYALFWMAAIVWVDSRAGSVASNLLICTGVWIVLLFIMPGLVSTAATARHPIESRADFERARRDAYDDTWSGRNAEIMDAFYASHPEIPRDRDPRGSLERYAIFQMRALELMRETLLPLEAGFDAQARQHREFAHALRFCSPLLLLHDLATTAAGTSMARVEDFRQQRDRFLGLWDRFYVTRIYTREPIEQLRDTPVFVYREPPLRDRASALLASGAGLLLPAAALVGLALTAFRRFPT